MFVFCIRDNICISIKHFTIFNMNREKLGYMHHVDINSTFCSSNEWAMSWRFAFMIQVVVS